MALGAGIALIFAVLAVMVTTAVSSSGRPVPSTRNAHASLTIGKWRIRVSLRHSKIGPLRVAARNLRNAPGRSWVKHDLVFRNTGDGPITLYGTEDVFWPDGRHPPLVATDLGCGYGWIQVPHHPREGAVICDAVGRLYGVDPHSRVKLPITLEKGRLGMGPLVAGRYVFRHHVEFRRGEPPKISTKRDAARKGVHRKVRIVYRIQRRSLHHPHYCPRRRPNLDPPGHRPPPGFAFNANVLEHRRVPIARRIAHRHGCTIRVLGEVETADLRPNRINVIARHGRVEQVRDVG